jgi:mannose-6-phosphate isomerase-like protein (cupin superfamily)
MQISTHEALEKLSNSKQLFLELFTHGTLSVEVYKPIEKDFQQPHEKDEVYLIISGEGDFYSDGKTVKFQKGDFLFVPAGIEHRFENFSEDFSTWVIFYGVKGGEANNSIISP